MIFILSFAVFGASGKERPFPTVRLSVRAPRYGANADTQWAGNPAAGNVDYCNGNGALD